MRLSWLIDLWIEETSETIKKNNEQCDKVIKKMSRNEKL